MNNIKELIIKNKIAIIIITAVILLTIIMVAILMISRSDNKENQTVTKENPTVSKENFAEEETTTENITTEKNEETKQNENAETTEEETTEEMTTQEQMIIPSVPVDYPYIVKINRIANCITVYGKDAEGNYNVPVKAITVSCGKNIDDTPLGQYNTVEWYKWGMMFDGSYAQYAYRIIDSILFHSVPYYVLSNGELDWPEYNKLGTSASHGCVRMTVADAKWLVENCPTGTQVIIYDDINNPGPLGKPDTIKIPENSPYKGWDPTDPNPSNPWHKFVASITYPSSKIITVDEGCSESRLRSYFSAKDTCGNSISGKIKFSGQFDLNKPGTYNNVTVGVTDAIGKYAEVKVTVIVKAKEVPTTEKETTTEELTTEEETTEEPNTTEQETTIDETTTEELTEDIYEQNT